MKNISTGILRQSRGNVRTKTVSGSMLRSMVGIRDITLHSLKTIRYHIYNTHSIRKKNRTG